MNEYNDGGSGGQGMSDRMRKAFEWWQVEADEGPFTNPRWLGYDTETNRYRVSIIQEEWEMWQKSHASLYVGLPNRVDKACDCDHTGSKTGAISMTAPTITDDLLTEIEVECSNAYDKDLTPSLEAGEVLSLIARVRELEKVVEAQRFLLEQSRGVMNDSKCLYVHLNAYLNGTASVDDILETKAGHEATQGDFG